MSVPPPPPAPIHRVATGTAPEVPSTSTPTPAAERAESKSDEKDIFSRADKWLPAMPTPDFKKWSVNRQEEILCFSEYVLQLRSWVALGSDVFALEIEQALRWPTELHTASLSKGAQVRSARLLAILQQVFASYPRADMLLRAYIEGVGADGVYQIHRGASGFEALRILGKEFSLRSRAEASFFRAEVLKKSFRGESNATAVSDIVRKLDVELSRYRKLVETLPTSHSRDGLEIQSADLTLILLRSLPAGARDYVTLHASDESFPSLRAAALRYEGQQRLFMELGPGSQARHVHEVAVDPDVSEWYEYQDWDDWEEDEEQLPVSAAMKGGDRCRQCGKAGHFAKNCSTDMSKVRCFKCGDSGHIGANCKKSPSAKAIDFRTDAAPDVTALIQRSGIPREYTVTRAGPQNHDSVGSVERGVREVKEGIATIRLELAKENCDLQDSLAGWEACARYVVAMHNLHGKVENTGKTGREVLRDSVEASRVSAMFCSHVLAETPESVPSVGRFVTFTPSGILFLISLSPRLKMI